MALASVAGRDVSSSGGPVHLSLQGIMERYDLVMKSKWRSRNLVTVHTLLKYSFCCLDRSSGFGGFWLKNEGPRPVFQLINCSIGNSYYHYC